MSVVMSQNFVCVVGRICYQDYNTVIAGIILSFQLQQQWSIIFQRSLALAHVCTIEYTGKLQEPELELFFCGMKKAVILWFGFGMASFW
jgi:hypothetical protein